MVHLSEMNQPFHNPLLQFRVTKQNSLVQLIQVLSAFCDVQGERLRTIQ